MIRFCPNCETERPLSEISCEGTLDGATCNWDLSHVPLHESGWRQEPATETAGEDGNIKRCPNGHPVEEGDVICLVCGADIDDEAAITDTSATGLSELNTGVDGTEIAGWILGERLHSSSAVREGFVVTHNETGRRAVLTLYANGSEPDPAVYDALRSLPRDHVPEIIQTGRWEDRAYEIAEEISGGSLLSLLPMDDGQSVLPRIVSEIGGALNSFTKSGLRHRDLQPGNILIRTADPLDLVITGFGSARLSEFDLDVVSPLETTSYMAPEAVAGGVTAASDWWSLGMILLEVITNGQCFQGVNQQAFLIQVVTNGVAIPTEIDPTLQRLLQGLLARDHRKRWQWGEVSRWLAGEEVEVPESTVADTDVSGHASIKLGGINRRKASAYALAAAEAANWDEARDQVARGVVAAWTEDAGLDPKIQSAVRQLSHAEGLNDDVKLSLALKVLHPAMPLVAKGNIVTPGWLLDHPEQGFDLIFGPATDFLRRMEAEPWLYRLRQRGESIKTKARQFSIALNEEELRINLLSTSKARLAAVWQDRRKLFPDTDHPGLISIIERRQTTEEDFILLLSAKVDQFRSVVEILDEARETADRAGVTTFDPKVSEEYLSLSRRDLHRIIETRTQGFARCGIDRVDEWADQFRLDHRMAVARSLALLAVPEEQWEEPPKQAYVSTLLDYFAKKISGGILRGPLTRMVIGKTTPRVDLMELDSERAPSPALLEQVLARTDTVINIDPAIFAGPETLERRMRALYTHSTLYKRDTGIDGLYLGFPFLLSRDERGNTKTRIAPILLWPIKVIPEVGNRGHVSVAFDRDREEVRLNPAFEGIMGIEASRRWLDAANELFGRASLTAADVMDGFGTLADVQGRSLVRLPGKDAEALPGRPQIACAAAFFHLAYMGQAIAENLRQLKGIPPEGSALETALKVTESFQAHRLPERVPELDRYFTAASDPSQEAAVLEARSAPGLLVEGPPGTGKSQTIVNMVADAIGRKKSLLVVCQKQAALEVVRKRLEAEGLQNRMIMVTDVNRDRQPILLAIREQLSSLRAQGGRGNSANLNRATQAARIEMVEAELDRHHKALHAVEDETGLSYRTLLGELIALEGDGIPLVEVSRLRREIGSMPLVTLATIEEQCGANARYWLAAKYESNPLEALKVFSPDEANIRGFTEDFNAFLQNETERHEVLARTGTALPVSDPEPYRIWYQKHDATFRVLTGPERTRLAHWLGICQRNGHGDSKTLEIVATLVELEQQLHVLDRTDPSQRLVAIATGLPTSSLEDVIHLAEKATASGSFFRSLNPLHWRRKAKLRSFLKSNGLESDAQSGESLLSALLWEKNLRPLRDGVKSSLVTIGEQRQIDDNIFASDLAQIAAQHAAALQHAQTLADRLAEFPDVTRIHEAASQATLEAYDALMMSAKQAYERFEARQFSRAALENLSQWFQPIWVISRLAAIDQDGTSWQELSAISTAHALLEPYQRFRLRIPEISADALRVFGILREKEAEFAAIPKEILDSAVRRVIQREARLAWKSRIEAANPTLLLERHELLNKVGSIAAADETIRGLNRELLIKGIDVTKIRSDREWEAVTRLHGQRAQRLREFMDKGADLGLMELRPVWLMNPDVASRVLPLKKGMFDIVIYDEASQMPLEYALPTLFRAGVAIVSGDEKQMPPTAFFSSKVENDEADVFDGEELEEDASEEARDHFSETWNRREIKDCPDLLQLAKSVLPTTTLQIHYRSAFRELIGFSNASFYGNRLNVPVRHPDSEIAKRRPIQVFRVDGIYKDQTNPAEAEKVAEILAAIWKTAQPLPTVGVVTFNRKQADLIEEIIEEKAENDPAFRRSLAIERERVEGGEDMSFFVKNVENVQGDERDVIIFSSTFGRNAQGSFRRFFGVLGQKGGERRLNVAVTRARRKVIMVTSMPVGEISDMLSSGRKPSTPRDYLQGYMEYARAMSDNEFDTGRTLLSKLVTETAGGTDLARIELDGFSAAVAEYLRDLGFDPESTHDGSAFGFDFAVKDPSTGLYGIGIECDAPRHHILETARAREVWRPKVLSRSISRIHRVSSHGWFHERDQEKAMLKLAVEHAVTEGPHR